MREIRLAKLILQNFKSIPYASIDFSGLNFLVGRNGSGKSNVADAFAFLAEAMEQPLQSVINRRGGAHNVAHRQPLHPDRPRTASTEQGILMGFAVEFSNLDYPYRSGNIAISSRYALELMTSRRGFSVVREQCIVTTEDGAKSWFERSPSGIRSNIDFLQQMPTNFATPETLLMQIFGGLMNFSPLIHAIRTMAVYSIEPSTLREFQNHDPGFKLLPDGSNAASVLKTLAKTDPPHFARLIEILGSIIPDLEEVRSVAVGRKQSLRFYQAWKSEKFGRERLFFDAFNMSDGTLRSFGILLAVFQAQRPSLILIEEPETSIHPGASGAILDLLRSVSRETQVIVTTHSPEVLDYANSEDVIRVVTWDKGSTRVDGVYGAAKVALQQHLSSAGELFRMRILDAPSMFETYITFSPLFEEIQ